MIRKVFKKNLSWVFSLLLSVTMGTLASVSLFAYGPTECIECHSKVKGSSQLKIDPVVYQSSVHALGFTCTDCHRGIQSDYHISRTGSERVDCKVCHQQRNYHGGAISENEIRPDCQQCHTRHGILRKSDPASTLHPDRISETCLKCHPQEAGETTYLSWFTDLRIESHNKQDLGSDYSMDNCLGCHQGQASHGDTKGLGEKSCSRCHMTAEGENALLGKMHPQADPDEQLGVFATAMGYQFVLIYIIWLGIRGFIRRKNRSNKLNR